MNSNKDLQPSRIIGIQFSILSPDEIRNGSVAHITSRDTYSNNKPIIGGLFDPRMGVLEPGLICPTDGHNYIKTPGYFGHIELAKPVFYIQYLNTIIKILRSVCFKCSKILISKDKYKHLLSSDTRDRSLKVFQCASKIKRCGEDTEEGCGCKQPKKIYKEGLSTIIAEWENMGDDSDDDDNKKMTLTLTPEIVLKIFRRISDDDVKFLGYKKNIYPYLKWSDALILSSKYEGSPNVLIEAISMKKIVISSNCPTGPKEILKNGKAGYLFKTSDFKDLARKITFSFFNKKISNKKINYAQTTIKRYSL